MGAFDEIDGLDWSSYTSSSLRETFNGDSFGAVLDRDVWTNNLMQSNVLPQIDTSFSSLHEQRHFSNSSEYSLNSLSSLQNPQSASSEDFPLYRNSMDAGFPAMPFSMSAFGQLLNAQNSLSGFRGSPRATSSNSSTVSYQEYPKPEYMTAKEKSLLHRRKQNRAAQRTFRQRKELERQELQARLDAAITSTESLQTECEELKKEIEKMREKIQELEQENIALKQKEEIEEIVDARKEDSDSYFPRFPPPAEKSGGKTVKVKA